MPQAGYLLLERLKKYLRASPDIKEPAEKHGLINFLNRLYFTLFAAAFYL